jgi:Orsellinic acid/F9775 biosynthesis cluster protein D
MQAIRFGAGDLLEYNSKYSLLICRECQYAIQKNALESHLLRHKIYRGDRQRLLSSIAQLDLLEPHDVSLPPPGSPPVDALPILSGYRCMAGGCQHLTASSKRMKRHWSEIHGLGGSVPFSSSFARPVKLQTFFRGTKVRYFEVASPKAPLVNTDDDGNDRDGYHEFQEESENANRATPSPPLHLPDPPGTAHGPFPTDFNLETLTYFHHFITITSLTLPSTEYSQSAKQHWQNRVVLRALRRHWLMCGLLAISALHLAALADDTMIKRIHREREAQFFSEFSAGLGQTTGCDLGFEAAEMEAEARETGEQIRCLLRCAQWALAEPTFDYESMAPSQLLSIMSNIRGCVVPVSTLRFSGIQNDGQERQEELSAQGLLQTRNSSHSGNPDTNSSSDKTPSVLLDRLRALPFHIAEALGRPESGQDVFATLSAITTVVECCEISFACDEAGAAWQGVARWLTSVSDHFNRMVLRHHPAALVVLAHWAAMLVKRAEQFDCWFLKGSAKMVVLQVTRQLSANGRAVLGLVEWLMGMVNDRRCRHNY